MKTINNFLTTLAFAIISVSAYSQVDPVGKDNVAIGGYDVVAYFTDNKALKGTKEFNHEYNKVVYYFTNAAHKSAFVKSPNSYLPQYDGYCAWAVAEKKSKFPINPETFTINNGKLYLFFNGPFNGNTFNTLELWKKEEVNLHTRAEANWTELKEKK